MVVHGGKTIENRVWTTRYRGPFLIHVAAKMTEGEYTRALDFAAGVPAKHRRFSMPGRDIEKCGYVLEPPFPRDLIYGAIVGKADLVDVLPPSERARTLAPHDWRMPNQYGFVLDNVVALEPHPCKGALSFWEFDDELACRLVPLKEGKR
jgi:hypothetical protein